MVPASPPISNSSSLYSKLLGTVPSVRITIAITVTLMFYSFFFSSQTKSQYLSFISLSLIFTLWSAGMGKSTIWQVLFLVTISRSDDLPGIRWSAYISKWQRFLCISFSRTDSSLCMYHCVVWLNSNFLHNSLWITFSHPVVSNLCPSLLRSLIMWLAVFSLSSHNRHYLFCCAWSVSAFTSSSSSCRATSTDIPDTLSPPFPIIHIFRQVLRATPRILIKLLYVGSSWSPCFC